MTMNPNWMGASDPRRREAIERALNVTNVGSVLMQSYINRVVQQLSVREFGAWATLDHRTGSGLAAYINQRTPGAAGGVWVADTAAATAEQGTYAQVTFPYKTLLTQGAVTRKAQAVGASYGDLLATSIAGKSEDFAAKMESSLINGDTNATPAEINGLLTQIDQVGGQVIANTSAAAGDDLTLAQLDAAIDAVRGSASRSDVVIYGSFLGMRKLNAALQAQQQFSNMTEIAAGFRVRTYDGIPMVTTTGINDDMVWSGTAITATTGAGAGVETTALIVVNKRDCWIEELTPLTVMPLAKTTSQTESFEMFWDGALVLGNTKGASILGGLSIV